MDTVARSYLKRGSDHASIVMVEGRLKASSTARGGRLMVGGLDGRLDGWLAVWLDGQMDGQMDD